MSKDNQDNALVRNGTLSSMFCLVDVDDISEITDYVANGSFASLRENVRYFDEPNYALLLRLTDFSKGWNGKYKYVDEHAYNFLSKSKVSPGDLIIANVGEPGKLFLAPDLGIPMTLAPNSILVKPNRYLHNKYVAYFFESPIGKSLIASIVTGSAQQKFNKTSFRKLKIPLASLSYQKAIVSKVEELFSTIDAGVEGLQQAKAKLQQYRQSVLKDAVTGKLTEKWREQNADMLEPANLFLDKILEERKVCWERKQLELYSIKGKLPKTDQWKEKYPAPKAYNWSGEGDRSHLYITLEYLKYYSIYGPRFSSDNYSDDGVLVLRTSDIDEHGRVNRNTAPKLSLTENEYKKYSVTSGDFLITRTGSIGTLAIYNDEYKAIPGAYLLHYKLISKCVNPEYIYIVFKSPDYQALLTQSTTGIGRPNLNAPTLEAMKFLLPSKMEQDEIVNIVKEKLKAIEKAEEDIEITLKKSTLQKSSVLAKAFSGQLVKNNETDETAEQLLEKIRLEKEQAEQKAKLVKKKPTARAKKMKKRSIIDVLRESDKALKAEELFELSGFKSEVSLDAIEEFYLELKKVAEDPKVSVDPYELDGVKQGDIFSFKDGVENEAG